MTHTDHNTTAATPAAAAEAHAMRSDTGRGDGVAEARAEQSQRVLIVEDERRMREMLIASVKECGMVGTGAPNAEAALRLLAGGGGFAVTLVDLNLPGMNGMEFCEIVHQRWPAVQIIILTGYGDLESAKRAIRLEVADFLSKPCGMDELEVALARARKRWLEHIPIASPSARAAEALAAAPPPPRASTAATASPAAMRAGARARAPESSPPQSPPPAVAPVSMEEMERQLIFAALARHDGNREATAAEVGISVRKLYYRLQQYQKQGFQLPG